MTKEELDAIRERASSHGRYLRENEFDGGEEITADALREATGDIDVLLAEIDRLTDDMHNGHTLAPHETRPGWLSCLAKDCSHETPMFGRCAEHGTIDACWAKESA